MTIYSGFSHEKWCNLWQFNSLLLKMTIEIVDFPMKNGWIFPVRKLLNYQRVITFFVGPARLPMKYPHHTQQYPYEPLVSPSLQIVLLFRS